MPEKKVNLNAGHRARMRSRYLASGLSGFQSHEILELLLFYALPRRDTNKIAHELINKFHSLAGVLDADINELKQIDGISEQSAVYLKMLPEVFKAYEMSKISERISVTKQRELKAYLKNLYINEVNEKIYVVCLDSQSRIICAEAVAEGTSTEVNVDVRTVAEVAIRNHCDTIILVHNHPDGNSSPSTDDLYMTGHLRSSLKILNIHLMDHYIIGKRVFSIAQNSMTDK